MLRLLVALLISCAFSPGAAFSTGIQNHGSVVGSASSSTSELSLGFLDDFFGGGESKVFAEASHILIKGAFAEKRCEDIKMNIYKKALGGGDPAKGVSPEKLMSAFAAEAQKSSSCPSKSNGGELGSFSPGQMVPEFDDVAFKAQVGIVHGPVNTQFGSHLILVTDRK